MTSGDLRGGVENLPAPCNPASNRETMSRQNRTLVLMVACAMLSAAAQVLNPVWAVA